jgi:pimeloyl-ACP methyl ester carboxylesterase
VTVYLATAWAYSSGALSGTVTHGAVPVIGGVVERPVTLANGSVTLRGGFYANPAGNSCAVIMLHGINADRSNVLAYGPLYWDRGCSLFSFDHRDHGRSSAADRTYGFYESTDVAVAIDWVLDRTGLDPGRVGIHGISYGGATALETLEIRDDLGFIVADSPYSSMARIVSETASVSLGAAEPIVRPLAFFLIEERANMLIGKVDPEAAVVGKQTPILLMHSAGDTEVPEDHSRRVAAANPAIERHVLRGEGIHLGAYRVSMDRYSRIVDDFLDRYVPAAAP